MKTFDNVVFSLRKLPLPGSVTATLQVVGATFVLNSAWTFLRWASIWLLPSVSLTRYQRPTGAWSLITGSSAGIGLGCAHALAKRGFNIVLLGHQTGELEEAQRAINATYPDVKVRVLVIDAISATPEDVEDVLRTLVDVDLSIVVNNLGGIPVAPSLHYRRLDAISSSQTEATLALNVDFMTHLTRTAIPILSKSGPSLIVNVGSASHLGFPGTATYSGSKAFVLAFTKAVAREMKTDGMLVDVTAAVLGEVKTQANGKAPRGSPDGTEFGEALISRVGRAVKRGEMVFHPCMGHAIADFMVEMMPRWLRERVLASVFRQKRRTQEKAE